MSPSTYVECVHTDWDSYLAPAKKYKPQDHKPNADGWEMAGRLTTLRLKQECAKRVLSMGLAYTGEMTEARAYAFMRKALEELE